MENKRLKFVNRNVNKTKLVFYFLEDEEGKGYIWYTTSKIAFENIIDGFNEVCTFRLADDSFEKDSRTWYDITNLTWTRWR